MDPIPDTHVSHKMTVDEARQLLGMNNNGVLNWCPNAFRAGPWDPGVDSNHPWQHKDVEVFLRHLGYGRLYPMPEILDDAKATAEGDRWRREVSDAYVEYGRMFRFGMDRIHHVLSQEHLLSDDDHEAVLREAWTSVSQSAMYADLFGSCAISEDSAQGYRFYLEQYRDCELVRDFGPGSNDMKLTLPRTIFDMKPAKAKVQADIIAPQRLALQVPGINVKSLSRRGLLLMFMLKRYNATPASFAIPDWEANHIGRSSRLIVGPYCDARFMAFPSQTMSYEQKYGERLRSALKIPDLKPSDWLHWAHGKYWHGCDIQNPTAAEALSPVFKDLRQLGRIFGWGDGLLILQSQGLILRYLHAVGRLLLQKQAASGSFPTERIEPLTEEESKHDPLLIGYEPPPEDVWDSEDTVRVVDVDEYIVNIPLALPELESRTVFQTVGHIPVHMSKKGSPCEALARVFGSHLEQITDNPLMLKRLVREHFGCHYGHVPQLRTKSSKAKKGKSGEKKTVQGQQKTQEGGPTGEDNNDDDDDDDRERQERTKRQLPHLYSTDLAAKSRLVDDVLRRFITLLVYSVEMPCVLVDLRDMVEKEATKHGFPYAKWADPRSTFPKSLQDAIVRFLFHARWFQDMLLTALLYRGFFHGSWSVRDYFERSPSNEALRAMVTESKEKSPWALPRGLAHFNRLGQLDFRIVKDAEDPLAAEMHRSLDMVANGHLHRFIHLHIIVEEFSQHCSTLSRRDLESSYRCYPVANITILLKTLTRATREFNLIMPFQKAIDEIRADPVKVRRMQESTGFGRFVLHHDDFPFERHVDPAACRDLRWLFGVRYANDPKTFVTVEEAKSRMGNFWTGIHSWVSGLGENSPRYFAASLGEALSGQVQEEETDEDDEKETDDGRAQSGEKDKQAENEQPAEKDQQGQGEAAEPSGDDAVLTITSEGCGPISTLNPRWVALEEPQDTSSGKAATSPTAARSAMEEILDANKKWILNRYRDTTPAPFVLEGGVEKGFGTQAGGAKSGTKGSKFGTEDWETIEMTFGGRKGQIRWHDWLRVTTGLGLGVEPIGGSAFKFSWTASSLIPKERLGSTSVVLHSQHGKDTAVSLRPTKVKEFVNALERFMHINLRVITRFYGPNPLRQVATQQQGSAAGGDAAQAGLAMVWDWDDEEEEEEEEDDEEEEEEWEVSESEASSSDLSEDDLAGHVHDEQDVDAESDSEVEVSRPAKRNVASEPEGRRPVKKVRFS